MTNQDSSRRTSQSSRPKLQPRTPSKYDSRIDGRDEDDRRTHDANGTDFPPRDAKQQPRRSVRQSKKRFLEYRAQQASVSWGMGFSPSMVRQLGAGPDLVVLAWLATVLHSSSGFGHQYIYRLKEEERIVTANPGRDRCV